MKKLLLIFTLIPFIAISQISEYELEFNSSSLDYVEMPNTSSVIASSNEFSISCWVNPQSNSAHGGIIGFRNNIDADFYLLHLQNTNNIEARFTNSLGINFDIVLINGLDFNQWQHLAFTFDGSYIRLYKNGNILDSTSATGNINNSSESFKLGVLDYQGSGFYLKGKLDEVRLWDIALTENEIYNWMCLEIDQSHPHYSNLMGYWSLNEGLGLTTTDQSLNGNNGTLLGQTSWQIATNCTNTSQLGCTDSMSCNYDYLANIDDGSCQYPPNWIFNSIDSAQIFTISLEIIVTTGSPPYTYLWNTLETTQVIDNIEVGVYWCIVTDVNCASDTAFFYVSNVPSSVNEVIVPSNIKRIVNALGQEKVYDKNKLLFFIYDDGTVEKRIVIE
jgi:hypothetical protein